jgi:hypothetical protein
MTKNEETRLRNLEAKRDAGKPLKPLDWHYLNKLTLMRNQENGSNDHRAAFSPDEGRLHSSRKPDLRAQGVR